MESLHKNEPSPKNTNLLISRGADVDVFQRSGGPRQWVKRQIVSPSLKSPINISYLDLHPRVWCWIINPQILFITPQTLTRCSAALESLFLSSSLRLSLLHVSDGDDLISEKVPRISFVRVRVSVDAHVGVQHRRESVPNKRLFTGQAPGPSVCIPPCLSAHRRLGGWRRMCCLSSTWALQVFFAETLSNKTAPKQPQ